MRRKSFCDYLPRIKAKTFIPLLVALGALTIPACRRADDTRMPAESDLAVAPVAALDAQSLFYSPQALALLERAGAEVAGLRDPEHNRTFADACKDPNLFRRLDRRYRFDALLLSGDPTGYRNLLDHLVQTKDWTLVHLDPTSLVFKRSKDGRWTAEALPELTVKYAALPAKERAGQLVQLGNKLLALNETDAARTILESAVEDDGESAAAHTALALYHVHFRRWKEAESQANRALEIDRDFVPALATIAQLQFSQGNADGALAYSRRLVTLTPNDPGNLFLHAKVAHQAHAFTEEIATLLKLVDLAVRDGVPTAGYRIYLAQAYASDGQAAPAVQQFEAALAEGHLSREQQDYVRESIERIRARAPL